jgi:hypothetical protein
VALAMTQVWDNKASLLLLSGAIAARLLFWPAAAC